MQAALAKDNLATDMRCATIAPSLARKNAGAAKLNAGGGQGGLDASITVDGADFGLGLQERSSPPFRVFGISVGGLWYGHLGGLTRHCVSSLYSSWDMPLCLFHLILLRLLQPHKSSLRRCILLEETFLLGKHLYTARFHLYTFFF